MSRNNNIFRTIEEIPVATLHHLTQKNIFFGHQSVGGNICQGIEDIVRNNSRVNLRIIETRSAAELARGVFGHFKIGKNQHPLSKNEDFASILNSGLGDKAAIAFFKYCYIDITETTDVSSLFSSYAKTMASLKDRYPSLLLVHVTIPLTVVQRGPRAWIKRAIGRKVGGYDANIQRNRFNDLLRNTYSGREPLFDLALLEATQTDGSQAVFKKNGRAFHTLSPEYSSDGRHLNTYGSSFIAERLLVFLIELATPHYQGGN